MSKSYILKWAERVSHSKNMYADNLAEAQAKQVTALAHWQASQFDPASVNLVQSTDEPLLWVLTYDEFKRHSFEINADSMTEAEQHRQALIGHWPASVVDSSSVSLTETGDDGEPAQPGRALPPPLGQAERRSDPRPETQSRNELIEEVS